MSSFKFLQAVVIGGIEMRFSHYANGTPVFFYTSQGVEINYLNHDLRDEDITILYEREEDLCRKVNITFLAEKKTGNLPARRVGL
jgi:hypothetical protein